MKKIKAILALTLAIVCAFGALALPVSAEAGMGNFQTAVHTYRPGQFPDVALGGWYTPYVATVYELGLMQGNSIGAFCPGGSITVAETLTLASRLHKLYHTGSAAFETGEPWYQVYADYAVENGLIGALPEDLNAPANRALFASVMAHALPAEALEEKNTVPDGTLPDVPMSLAYSAEIYLLYRAGVLTGNDAAGTFAPNSEIRRSEVAAITARLVKPEQRCSFGVDVCPDLTEKSRAEDSFFADAAMLGNSLVDGMMLYSGIPMSYYGGTGLTVYKNKLDTLLQKQFGKIYIEFGINEIGGSVDGFIDAYREIIDKIKAAQPDAQIYLMAITPVTKARNDQGTFTQKKIQSFNEKIRELAAEKQCWYLDTFGGLCDNTGYLPASYAGWDGSPHLEVAGYKAWAEVVRCYYAEQ